MISRTEPESTGPIACCEPASNPSPHRPSTRAYSWLQQESSSAREPDPASVCPGCAPANLSGVRLMDLAAEVDRVPASSPAATRHRCGWPGLSDEQEHRTAASRIRAKDCAVATSLQLYLREIE